MKQINLIDNDRKNGTEVVFTPNTEIECNLRFISDTTISELTNKQGENLLIFPHCLNALNTDLEGKDTIFSLRGNKIYTSNYMGFIGRGSTEVSICSRFDDGENNYFMHYMLQKIFAVNLFDMKISKDNQSVWDFLIYLFPHFLKKAMRHGLYKKYQRNNYNDARVRGTLDVARHIKQNTPFTGKIAYSTREYSYDNKITQLIRHTIEYINCHKLGGRNVLQCDIETRQAVSQIKEATQTYTPSQRAKVVGQNLRVEYHPFFMEYSPLQKLCLNILRREKINFGSSSDDKVYGLIFDGAWLWEEYLNTVLKPLNFTHPQNRERRGRINLFTNNRGESYPDFYKDGIVLDAKYKLYSEDESIDRGDLHQIITYMHCLPAKLGGLIYPMPPKDSEFESYKNYGILKGDGGNIYKLNMQIANYSNIDEFKVFCSKMKESENRIQSTIVDLEKQYK